MRRHYSLAAAAITLALVAGMGPEPVTKAKPKTPAAPPTPAVPAPSKPPAKDGPAAVADAYFTLLAAGRPYRAVDECFDTDAFARRVFGGDLDRVDASEALFTKQLSAVFVKAAVSAADRSLQQGFQHDEFETEDKGDEVRVTCTLTLGNDGDDDDAPSHEMTLVVQHTGAAWKIVDIEPMGKIATEAYNKNRAQRASPVVFMEAMLGGLIKGKIDKGAPTAAPAQESLFSAQRTNIQAQLQSLSNQIELYKARTGNYPNLLAHGWTDLISAGYIKQPPVNPVNGRSEVCAGKRGKTQYGWCWDAASGTLGASFYDEKTMALTPGAP